MNLDGKIYCMTCWKQDKHGRLTRNVLGEIDEQDNLLVLRGYNFITRISGKDFTVYCDICNEPVYFRKEELESISNRESRISRQSFSIEIGTIGLGSN